MTRRALSPLLSLALLAGCGGEDGATGVVLRVEAVSPLAERVSTLHVTVRGGTAGGGPDREDIHEYGVDEALGFPVDVAVAPSGGDPRRRFEAELVARDADGATVTSVEVAGGFAHGGVQVVRIVLHACCTADGPCIEAEVELDRGEGDTTTLEPACRPSDPERDEAPDSAPALRFPWNGYATGSALSQDALRPTFRWDEARGATEHELQLTDSCPSPSECDFEGATSVGMLGSGGRPATRLDGDSGAAAGGRWGWRVRGCNGAGCGPWSPARYLDVGRQPTDVDGDGRADLVAGAPGTAGGRLHVLHGEAGGPTGSVRTLALEGDPAGARFGAAVDTGDLDGDGRAEIVAGAPGHSDGELAGLGRVLVVRWGDAGLDVVATLDPPEESRVAGARFGAAVSVVGDLDGDGRSDVVVGAPGAGGGAAFLFFGTADGVDPDGALMMRASEDALGLGAAAGRAGDVNGDGWPDALVAAPEVGEGASGSAFLYRGAPGDAFGPDPSLRLAPDGGRGEGGFGLALGGDDLDGDGLADPVVGAPQARSGSGRALVFWGDELAAGVPEPLENPQSGGAFLGAALASGRFEADALPDLLVGAPGNTAGGVNGAGVVYRFAGGDVTVAEPEALSAPEPQNGAMLGRWIAVGDLDGDGLDDAFVGAPGWDGGAADQGRVYVFPGDGSPPIAVDNPEPVDGAGFGVL